MATSGVPSSCGDIEQGRCHSHSDAAGAAGGSADDDEDSLCFSDADDRSWRSRRDSDPSLSSFDAYRASGSSRLEIDDGTLRDGCRKSCDSQPSLDLDGVELEAAERDCRICHLALAKSADPESAGASIVLGCSCKNDLSLAHRQCAETWFKIKGNKTCEICGSIAHNVIGPGETEVAEQWSEVDAPAAPPMPLSEPRRFWQGHRFLNFLLACLVFAFVISWLFHFNVPG